MYIYTKNSYLYTLDRKGTVHLIHHKNKYLKNVLSFSYCPKSVVPL